MDDNKDLAIVMIRGEADNVIIRDVRCCARCGGNHDKLFFKKLAMPCRDLTHWAPCPTNGDPVMMRLTLVTSKGEAS